MSSTMSRVEDCAARADNGASARALTVSLAPAAFSTERTRRLTRLLATAGWCPIGPCLVSPSALKKDPHDLKITTTVNGKLVQETSTRNLLAGVVSPRHLLRILSRER